MGGRPRLKDQRSGPSFPSNGRDTGPAGDEGSSPVPWELPSETAAIGRLIRAYRHTRGLTIEELAERSGVSVRAISNLERGRNRRPQRYTIEALSKALDLDLAQMQELDDASSADRAFLRQASAGLCALPPTPADFTGRDAEIAQLTAAVAERTDPIAHVICGPPGVGKSTLAIGVANTLAATLQDAAVLLDMRGLDPQPLPVAVAAEVLVRSLAPTASPAPTLEARLDALRNLLSTRRTVIVLDNVSDEAQVRPLLETAGGCVFLLTSRRRLTGLWPVHRLDVTPLASEEAIDLLLKISGRPVDDDLRAVAELCGQLPLALRLAGIRLASHREWSVRTLVVRLQQQERRLATLSAGDVRIEATFEMSYRHLSTSAASLFRHFALVPGPDTGPALLAVVAEQSLARTEDHLDELVESGLVMARYPDRYFMHDLVRDFATHQFEAQDRPEERAAARNRGRQWLLRMTTTAGRWFSASPPVDERLPAELDTAEAAREWLQTEAGNWLPALREAGDVGEDDRVVEVGESLHWFSDLWMFWGHWTEVYELSSDAALRLADDGLAAWQLGYLAWARGRTAGDVQAMVDTADSAVPLARSAGDQVAEGWAHQYAAQGLQELGEVSAAAARSRRAVDAFDAAGDRYALAQALNSDARALNTLGDLAGAGASLEQALAVTRALWEKSPGALEGLVYASSAVNLSVFLVDQQRWREAADLLTPQLPHIRQVDQHELLCRALASLGRALNRLERQAEGAELLREAIRRRDQHEETELAAELRAELDELSP